MLETESPNTRRKQGPLQTPGGREPLTRALLRSRCCSPAPRARRNACAQQDVTIISPVGEDDPGNSHSFRAKQAPPGSGPRSRPPMHLLIPRAPQDGGDSHLCPPNTARRHEHLSAEAKPNVDQGFVHHRHPRRASVLTSAAVSLRDWNARVRGSGLLRSTLGFAAAERTSGPQTVRQFAPVSALCTR